MLHESLKPAANCFSLKASLGNKNKDPAVVLIGVHRAALLCFMDLIQAVLSAGMGGGSAIYTLWALQLLKEPQQAPGFPSSWSHAGKKHSPPPGLGSQRCAAGEQAGDATWGKMQNSRECTTGSCKNSGEVKSTSVNTLTGTWWQCFPSRECRLLKNDKEVTSPKTLFALGVVLCPITFTWSIMNISKEFNAQYTETAVLRSTVWILDICWW